jgi:hypothetical protein
MPSLRLCRAVGGGVVNVVGGLGVWSVSSVSWSALLQAFEEGEQSVVGVVAAWGRCGRGSEVKGALFDSHVGVEVDVGGADVGVAEPERDDRAVHTGLKQ